MLLLITSNSLGELISRARKVNNQKGWILVDALIGLVILSVALTSMTVMYTQATKANMKTQDYDAAVYIAQRYLENIKQFDGTPAIASLSSNSNYTNPPQDSINGVTFTTTINKIPSGMITETLDSRIYPYQATVSWIDNAVSPPIPRSIKVAAYYYSN